MSLVLPLIAGLGLALLLGGRLGRLADLRFRAVWLFYLAMGLQVVAFPTSRLPWRTPDRVAVALWLASYAVIALAAMLNLLLPGIAFMGLGMLSNVLAVVSNGGHMPVRPAAMAAAGYHFAVRDNSAALASPHLPWLIDRWAAPGWVPLANFYSVGDVLIAVGTVVFALGATGALGLGARARRRTGAVVPSRG